MSKLANLRCETYLLDFMSLLLPDGILKLGLCNPKQTLVIYNEWELLVLVEYKKIWKYTLVGLGTS